MTGAMANLLDEILDGSAYPSDRHRTALYLAVECWGRDLDEHEDRGRQALAARIRDQWKRDLQDDGYGFVVITFLLITVLAAAISWSVERLLDWLYPKNAPLARRMDRLLAARCAA